MRNLKFPHRHLPLESDTKSKTKARHWYSGGSELAGLTSQSPV